MSSPDPVRHRYVARAFLFPYPQSTFKSRKKRTNVRFLLTDLAASPYKEITRLPKPKYSCRAVTAGRRRVVFKPDAWHPAVRVAVDS
jgi:hypothetical protein